MFLLKFINLSQDGDHWFTEIKMYNDFLFTLIFVIIFFSRGFPQFLYNPNDERFKSLYLEKVQSDYEVQSEEFNRQKILHEKGLISDKEFQISEANFKSAQITYQQAILSLAFEQPHIVIDNAVKYQSQDGKIKVRLTLRNTTSGIIPGKKVEETALGGISTDVISNVYVSLLNDVNAVVSQPYEEKISIMPYNKPVTINFMLLQDIDYVTVKSVYGDKSEQLKILLQKDASANKVIVNSDQFSQEGNLGAQISYNLSLALYSTQENIYKLEALNLPNQISYDFLGASTGQAGAKISQVKFSQEITNHKLSLVIYLPDHSDSSVVIDKPINFIAAVVPAQKTGEFNSRIDKQYAEEEFKTSNIGYVKLELIPRGVGKLNVRSVNFYKEIKPDENVITNLTVLNEGTRRLNNIKVTVEPPLNWHTEITPDLIQSLLPGKEASVTVKLFPPSDISVGDYEATIKTESMSDNQRIQSEDKKLRIHVYADVNIWGTVALIALLVGIILGIVIFGVRLSKK